jgi:hypothetical protein
VKSQIADWNSRKSSRKGTVTEKAQMADGHQGQTEEIGKSGNNAIRRRVTKPAADSG